MIGVWIRFGNKKAADVTNEKLNAIKNDINLIKQAALHDAENREHIWKKLRELETRADRVWIMLHELKTLRRHIKNVENWIKELRARSHLANDSIQITMNKIALVERSLAEFTKKVDELSTLSNEHHDALLRIDTKAQIE